MSLRPIICLSLAVSLLGCTSPEKKKSEDEKERKERKDEAAIKQAQEPAFLAFVGRLRAAVGSKDMSTLSSMMTVDFGYRWDTPPVGDNIFTYWDMNDTWPTLARTLREQFVPHDGYMVAPAAAVDAGYTGYRAGIRMVNGNWRFAYFVPGEGVLAQ